MEPVGWMHTGAALGTDARKTGKGHPRGCETLRRAERGHELLGSVCPSIPGLASVSCFQTHPSLLRLPGPLTTGFCLDLAGGQSTRGRETSGVSSALGRRGRCLAAAAPAGRGPARQSPCGLSLRLDGPGSWGL